MPKEPYKEPKTVMCMICGDVLSGAPGAFSLPRDCVCGATVVIPTAPPMQRVRWDAARYAAEGLEEPEVEWTSEVQDQVGYKGVVPTSLDEGFAEGYRRLERGY